MNNGELIELAHGNGGALTAKIVSEIFQKKFDNNYLYDLSDSAVLDISAISSDTQKIAFTTDSFVVDPIFFPGGDIGKLSVCGTINDLAMVGAKPAFLSCGFIIEEGFKIEDLKRIADSMGRTAFEAGIKIVAGDTKVVQKGMAHKVFINTSGIGIFDIKNYPLSSLPQEGDEIIINGTLGDHGIAILSARESFGLDISIVSDCANLYPAVKLLRDNNIEIRFMRDATRGGAATVLNEAAQKYNIGIEIREDSLPVSKKTAEVCEILGYDPLYIANEGKMIIIVRNKMGDAAVDLLRSHPLGINACKLGRVVGEHRGRVVLETLIKGKRIIDLLITDQFPRIC